MKTTNYFLLAAMMFGSTHCVNAVNMPTERIKNEKHAQKICPSVCSNSNMKWNGKWSNLDQGKISVCECDVKLWNK